MRYEMMSMAGRRRVNGSESLCRFRSTFLKIALTPSPESYTICLSCRIFLQTNYHCDACLNVLILQT